MESKAADFRPPEGDRAVVKLEDRHGGGDGGGGCGQTGCAADRSEVISGNVARPVYVRTL